MKVLCRTLPEPGDTVVMVGYSVADQARSYEMVMRMNFGMGVVVRVDKPQMKGDWHHVQFTRDHGGGRTRPYTWAWDRSVRRVREVPDGSTAG